MADLTIHDLDEDVLKGLEDLARKHGHSLEEEVRQILTDAVQRYSRSRRKELRARAERIAAMTPDVPQTDSALLIREDRDR